MWNEWKSMGNIVSGGSMDQPALWKDIIDAFNECEGIMREKK